MSQAERENLSALVDGELGADEVRFMLRRIDASVSLRGAFERYHVIGASLRQEMDGFAAEDLAARIRHDIEAADASSPRQSVHRWLRWSAGGAIAAGVAVAALVAVQPQMRDTHAPVTTAGATPAQPALADAGETAVPTSAPRVPRWLSASPAARLAQPAAATFGAGGWRDEASHSLGYNSPGLAPYMSIPHARAPAARGNKSASQARWWAAHSPQQHAAPRGWRLQRQ
jgi:sigma-E factor negative regulatory protein RseA